MNLQKVFVALSGGVDSSVAAALLKERGFDVAGIHMKMWDPRGSCQLPATSHQLDTTCRQQFQDRIDAMAVAAKLDIPFRTWDFTEEYRRAVVEYMIREYAVGRTPNPDVMCNSRIKFGLFLERAVALGADYIATGHYARLMRKSEIPVPSRVEGRNPKSETNSKTQIQNSKLFIGNDTNKDQSYFLWTLTQEQLRYCFFPIGEYTKPEVREMARKFGLLTAEKPDSQGICFIGEIDVRQFLASYIPERRGRIFSTAGKVVGEHNGAEFYTIGQRHGLGIGGGIPYYVAEKNLAANTLIVAEGPYDETLFRSELIATDVNWISGRPPAGGFPLRCEARIRYRQPLQPCRVDRIRNHESRIMGRKVGWDNSMIQNSKYMIHAQFDEPQRAVTPGQSVVFYLGEEMLGGGIIT